MKVTLKFDNKSISVNTEGGFELLVDDEVLLSHDGDNGGYADVGYEQVQAKYAQEAQDALKGFGKLGGCCGGCKCDSPYPKTSGTSSLFEHAEEEEEDDVTYINFLVPNSSFIEIIRWWSYEEALGENALEVHFKDGENALEVHFKDGNYACYSDVPEGIINEWIEEIKNGGSAGRYFNVNIKNKFELLREGESNE